MRSLVFIIPCCVCLFCCIVKLEAQTNETFAYLFSCGTHICQRPWQYCRYHNEHRYRECKYCDIHVCKRNITVRQCKTACDELLATKTRNSQSTINKGIIQPTSAEVNGEDRVSYSQYDNSQPSLNLWWLTTLLILPVSGVVFLLWRRRRQSKEKQCYGMKLKQVQPTDESEIE